MLNGLDLFSGIAGISLALEPWVRTVAYCESDRYAQGVLLSRMQSGNIDRAPIWDDVQTLQKEYLPRIDIIFGGFPCQDISVAGNGIGLDGKRSGLFFEIIRLTSELRPRFVFLENVPAITVRGLDRVLLEITSLGYDCRWTVVSAAELGALHRRDRWFLLAHSNSKSSWNEWEKIQSQNRKMGFRSTTLNEHDGVKESLAYSDSLWKQSKQEGWKHSSDRPCYSSQNVSDSIGFGCKRQDRSKSKFKENLRHGYWEVEPDVGRVVDGIPHRLDRIKCLGNSVVPIQAREAFMRLMGVNKI